MFEKNLKEILISMTMTNDNDKNFYYVFFKNTMASIQELQNKKLRRNYKRIYCAIRSSAQT